MRRCGFVVWLVLACLTSDALQQYREKNISGAETDAVQAILARYLQRRLQGSQLSTPPPPAVLFSSNNQARARQAQRATSNALPRNVSEKEGRERVEDYEDYEDDLESFEDSERSRTRFDLFAGKSFNLAHISSSASIFLPFDRVFCRFRSPNKLLQWLFADGE
ncbi:hypothetical protein WN51_03050 [Melipona quadrifasciata]|uniref:Uncharacterized protein n=1 Tax=Melipona quadrifasciata TaxID=166423 RepID=A0A0M8ZVD1_9HYME|nr:hypothetical protein WN51_03050 [Melipona quadrifasciata]